MSLQKTIWLWLDDVRYPPSNRWTWVKTAAEAIEVLKTKLVSFASLDHDLSPEHYPWSSNYDISKVKLTSGQAVINFLEEEYCIGDRLILPFGVRVHSMNYGSAEVMVKVIEKLYHRNFQCDVQHEVLPWHLAGQYPGFWKINTTQSMIERYRNVRHSA